MPSIYDFNVQTPDGKVASLKEYSGKVVLIVNTASKCGFTPQFQGLQTLYEQYKDAGFAVLGFPCDQFNNQEYENIDETMEFCQRNYGVTFPMFAKINVNGDQADPLFQFLAAEKKGLLTSKIKWNFTKFLIDRTGQVVGRYAPTVTPDKLKSDIEKLL